MWSTTLAVAQQLGGALIFYTCLPLPRRWPLSFDRIARWSPAIGAVIGIILGLTDTLLAWVGVPLPPRSALVVALWVGITGGLHLDGAMDTADGLAVESERRLHVMADSHSGAFGVIVAILILGLKMCALMALTHHRWLMLLGVTIWGRWGQVVAIAQYPYLKPTGKGAFHRQNWQGMQDLVPGLLMLAGLTSIQAWYSFSWITLAGLGLWGILITTVIGAWFNRQLGGMTGDVYGAIVEWSEALLLCGFITILESGFSPFT